MSQKQNPHFTHSAGFNPVKASQFHQAGSNPVKAYQYLPVGHHRVEIYQHQTDYQSQIKTKNKNVKPINKPITNFFLKINKEDNKNLTNSWPEYKLKIKNKLYKNKEKPPLIFTIGTKKPSPIYNWESIYKPNKKTDVSHKYKNGDIFKETNRLQLKGKIHNTNSNILKKLLEIPNKIGNEDEYVNGNIYTKVKTELKNERQRNSVETKPCDLKIHEKINNKAINITQNNLQKAILPTLTLNLNLETHEYSVISPQTRHIACLQEPYCPIERPAILPKGYRAIYSTIKPKPRAIILASQPYDKDILKHEDLSNRDTTTISIKDPNNNTKRLFITSAYMPHDEEIKEHLALKAIQQAEKGKCGIIVCADTNAHSTIWGNERNNARGNELETIIAKYNLNIKNTNMEYTRSLGDNKSTIDLTLTNQYAPNMKNWQLLRGVSDSDHEIIQMQIEEETPETSAKIRRDHKKCNTKLFRETLQQSLISNPCKTPKGQNEIIRTRNDIDHTANTLTKHIRNSYDKSCPEIKKTNKPKNFWTRNIKSKHKRLIKARKRLSYLKIIKWREEMFKEKKEYRKGRKIFRKIMLKAHNKTKIKYFESIKKTRDIARLGKVLENNGQQLGTLIKTDGTYTTTPEETLNTLADELLGKPKNDNNMDKQQNNKLEQNKANLDKIFSMNRIKMAVKELKKNKCPGKDGITNEMIQESIDIIDNPLQTLFKSCMAKGYVPKIWQNSNGTTIAKPGKTDYTKPKSFRIITLSSNLLKLMETLVLWHLQKDLKMEQSINKNQHGFRSGHATDTAVAKLIQKIQKTLLDPGNHALGIFLDINGAFDNLPFEAIKKP